MVKNGETTGITDVSDSELTLDFFYSGNICARRMSLFSLDIYLYLYVYVYRIILNF